MLTTHPVLMTRLGAAMRYFYDATVELGVADRVTAFTASDFGRTLTSNANGSDHGWGSHHFVMGGAVNGRAFYGTPPAIANNGPDDVGQGRLLPSALGRSIWRDAGELVRRLQRPDVDRPAQHQQLQSQHLEPRLRLSLLPPAAEG